MVTGSRAAWWVLATAAVLVVLPGGPRAETCDLQFADAVGDWTGPCTDGIAHGWGSAAGSNWRYEGAARDGKAQGRGTVTWSDGAFYEGDFVAGKRTGQGVAVDAEGDRHEGQFRDGVPHGWGTGTSPEGGHFTGEWRDGVPHGEGVETVDGERREVEYRDGERVAAEPEACKLEYEGELFDWSGPCTDGLAAGSGRAEGDGGAFYEGAARAGKPHGEGTVDDGEGFRYEGGWQNGQQHGSGILTRASDGYAYEGEFRDGMPHGTGTETVEGERYTGEFRDGERVAQTPEALGPKWSFVTNQACQVWNYGEAEQYEPFTWSGDCAEGMAAGEGRLTVAGDDGVYEGTMRDGKLDGQGTWTWGPTGDRYEGGWREGGLWWQVDLGALFWIDELFIYFKTRGEGTSSFLFERLHHGRGYNILFSDGRLTTGGDLDLTFLLREDMAIDAALASARLVRHIRYLFEPRKMRYIFWHGHEDQGWFSHPMEFMLFSPGYPAQVMLRSDFIDLGQLAGDGRAKAIKRLRWEATTPDQTQLQVRSRSGNVLQELYTFYDKKGEEVTETRYNSLPKVIRGPIDTMVVVGADWGAWSNFYQFSGEAFKSETPRRFIQLELILSTEDPAVAPVLHALALDFEDALVAQAAGQVMPRQAVPNEATQFTYTLWTNAAEGDSGFDRLRFSTPSAVDATDVRLRVGGEAREPHAVRVVGDSLLLVDLLEVVRTDSVTVEFTTKVLRNATVFAADLGQEARPDLWQSVEAADRQANLVFLPDLPGSERLIGDLQVTPSVFSPNGDGINDRVQIRFALFKAVDASPSVRIFDLAGREVAALVSSDVGVLQSFSWGGLDASGARVVPGVYVCRIDAGADAGQGEVIRTIAVAY